MYAALLRVQNTRFSFNSVLALSSIFFFFNAIFIFNLFLWKLKMRWQALTFFEWEFSQDKFV